MNAWEAASIAGELVAGVVGRYHIVSYFASVIDVDTEVKLTETESDLDRREKSGIVTF